LSGLGEPAPSRHLDLRARRLSLFATCPACPRTDFNVKDLPEADITLRLRHSMHEKASRRLPRPRIFRNLGLQLTRP
jgi:hypothetical protein